MLVLVCKTQLVCASSCVNLTNLYIYNDGSHVCRLIKLIFVLIQYSFMWFYSSSYLNPEGTSGLCPLFIFIQALLIGCKCLCKMRLDTSILLICFMDAVLICKMVDYNDCSRLVCQCFNNWQLCEGSLLGCEDTFMSQ